jgi:hypothetical protein
LSTRRILGAAVTLVTLASCKPDIVADTGLGALLRVEGAQFHAGTMPTEPASGAMDAPALALGAAPIVPGSRRQGIAGPLPKGATAAAVGLDGDRGYWTVLAGFPAIETPENPSLTADLALAPAIVPGEYRLVVRAVDAAGVFGKPFASRLKVLDRPAPFGGKGTLVVTLAWDADADLDLHVVPPTGTEIFARKINSYTPPRGPGAGTSDAGAWMSGGILDFDSNASCVIDGKNQENVGWTVPPPSGHYVVRVDTFSMCGQAEAYFKVDATLNGAPVGHAEGSTSGDATRFSHDEGAGVLAFEFDVP